MKFPFFCPVAHWCSPLLPGTMPIVLGTCGSPRWAGNGEEVELSGQGVWQAAGGKIPSWTWLECPNLGKEGSTGDIPSVWSRGSNVAGAEWWAGGLRAAWTSFLKASAAGHHSTLGRAEGRTRLSQGCKMPENWKFSHCAVNGAE